MSQAPKIPTDQLSAADKGAKPEDASQADARDLATEVRDGQPGDAGVDTDEQGRFGNIKQNTTHQGAQRGRE